MSSCDSPKLIASRCSEPDGPWLRRRGVRDVPPDVGLRTHDGHEPLDRCAGPGAGVDAQGPAGRGGPRGEAVQSPAAVGSVGGEPGSLVADDEPERVGVLGELDGDRRAVRVLPGVVDRLEAAEVHGLLRGLGVAASGGEARVAQVDRRFGAAEVGGEGGDESLVAEQQGGHARGDVGQGILGRLHGVEQRRQPLPRPRQVAVGDLLLDEPEPESHRD